jgi:RNase adaptor protein for sRNA GlmZ degradation
MTDLLVLSFGYGHDEDTPAADLVVDVRHRFRDPHIDPVLRQKTGLDPEVIAKVLGTEGVTGYIHKLHEAAVELLSTQSGTVTIAFGCVGGRHRSVVMADELGRLATADGLIAEVDHLHVDRPVIRRERGDQ